MDMQARGKVEYAPTYILMQAKVQKNPDGTWTAQLPALSAQTFTRSSRAAALLDLEQTLAEIETDVSYA